MMDKNCLY